MTTRLMILALALLAGCVTPTGGGDLNSPPAIPADPTPGPRVKAPGAVHAAIRSLFGGNVAGRGATNGQALVWDGTQLRWEPGTISTAEADTWATVLARGNTTGANSPIVASGQGLRFGGTTSNDTRVEPSANVQTLSLRAGDDSSWGVWEAAEYQALNASSVLKCLISSNDVAFVLASAGRFAWSSNTSAGGAPDAGLERRAPGVVVINDGSGTTSGDRADLEIDDLTADAVTLGTALPVGSGGTGQTTATAAFDGLDPLTTQGDVLYHNGTNSVRLAAGTNGQVLTTGGAGANPSWATPSGGGTPWITLMPQDGVEPASNPATFNVRNNHSLLEFDQSTAETIIFETSLPDSYASGSNLTVKIYWGTTATTGNCIWQVQVEYIDDGTLDLDADSFDTAVDSSADAASGTSGVLTTTTVNLSNGAADDIVAGAPMRIAIIRKAADASDTLAADAQLFFITVEQ